MFLFRFEGLLDPPDQGLGLLASGQQQLADARLAASLALR
jgi:hypothetical protein